MPLLPVSESKIELNNDPKQEERPQKDDRENVPDVLLERCNEAVVVVDEPLEEEPNRDDRLSQSYFCELEQGGCCEERVIEVVANEHTQVNEE